MGNKILYFWAGSLLVAPLLSFVLARIASRTITTKRAFIYLNSIILCAELFLYSSSWSLAGVTSDQIALAIGYLTYCNLVWAAWYLRDLTKRRILFIIGCIPMVGGLLWSTVGIFGLALVLVWFVPESDNRIDSAWSYRITPFGFVTTEHSGESLRVIYHPSFLPIFERTVFKKRFDYDECGAIKSVKMNQDDNGTVSIRVYTDKGLIYESKVTK
jgi:hypothetical protein